MRIPHAKAIGVIFVVPLFLGAVACGTASGPTSAVCAGKIASLSSLSGTGATLGTSLRNSAKLAVDQFLEKNPHCTVELVEKDEVADNLPKMAEIGAELAGDPGILGVVGPIRSSDALEIGKTISDAGLTMLTVATSPRLSQQNWSTFHRASGNDASVGAGIGRYIMNTLQPQKLFIVYHSTEYGTTLSGEVEKAVSPVGKLSFPVGQKDFSTVIPSIISSGADLLFIGAYSEEAAPLVQQLRAAGFTGGLIGADGLRVEVYSKTPDARGSHVVVLGVPADELGGTYIQDYTSRFGADPGPYSAEAFDATNILLAGIKAGKATRPEMETFVDAYDGEGIVGKISFTPTGELNYGLATMWAYKISEENTLVPVRQLYVK